MSDPNTLSAVDETDINELIQQHPLFGKVPDDVLRGSIELARQQDFDLQQPIFQAAPDSEAGAE